MKNVTHAPRCEALAALAFVAIAFTGCGYVPKTAQVASRYDHGVVYILPGIEGPSPLNTSLAVGLDNAKIRPAIEIYDWTTGIPGNFLWNLSDLDRNRREASRLARRILAYRDRHPGGQVSIIGHSGGGGIALLTLEALPPEPIVDNVVLLAPAVSPRYDLRKAMRRAKNGMYHLYSPFDVGLLGIGTTVFGTVDRDHGPSAGAVGFSKPPRLSEEEWTAIAEQLHQIKWSADLVSYGAAGDHAGWSTVWFAEKYLAPLVETGRPPAAKPDATAKGMNHEDGAAQTSK
ncbi:MAG: alpha/beta fold hydrolase [Phycisphaerales bacterium]|nr:alpha/beta fold hydrolase [Phycisphaerales bacterium]